MAAGRDTGERLCVTNQRWQRAVSGLRQFVLFAIIVTCTGRSLGDYRHLGGRLKLHMALKVKAVGRIMVIVRPTGH